MPITIDKTMNALFTLAAITVAAVMVHREFFPVKAVQFVRKSEYLPTWRAILPDARVIGSRSAPVTLVEFSDLQCPFCKKFQATVRRLRRIYPRDVAIAWVHLPLEGHSNAMPAAHVVECANESGRFFEAVDYLFENQDSLGKRPWTWAAKGAGIRDTLAFKRCMADTTTPPLVKAGMARATTVGLTATPTVVLNGWRFGTPPSDTELIRAIGDLLAGRRPYKDYPSSALAPLGNR